MNPGADSEEVRVGIEARDRYHIMWLAGVRALDLTQHCLKTFGECDRHRVDTKLRRQTLRLSAANPPAAWYLCALPIPWDWSRNAHLAFEYAPGETWAGDALVRGLGVHLTNARPIMGWGEHSIPRDAPMRNSRLHRTCRNWQFAWWLRTHRDVPDAQMFTAKDISEEGPEQLSFS
ncbi:hypothetical protein M878_26160 [Streptomyces roseochromogenus subsp. oscitans DS 12.976]|uniref:Uncharacterized protein n=2 Tax=Streptomyces roseochromogenus TaxID=285450 RepID=V6K6E0_STRRC|nr:hypothetical protein M878_26160 [Streptomyces roseochromogenus subsp. oscitans DS 12.976]